MNARVLETALGGLLHDIGKFSQRAFRESEGLGAQSRGMTSMICPTGRHGGPTHLHTLYTNEFVETLPFLPGALDRSRVANLAAYHHRPDTDEQRVITAADWLSSGMERRADEESPEGNRHFRRVRLFSVASTIALPDLEPAKPSPLLLRECNPGETFPDASPPVVDLTEEYRSLWNRFTACWAANRCGDPLGFVNRAISILERFTWCIPSATNAVPDISLFDHLKTTSAIAVCLQDSASDKDEPFLLVAADLTGIQRYIFGVHQGAGAPARRLRARSFQVTAYLESISLGLLHQLGLPLTQRILFAGGKFHLLLPNSPETRREVDALRRSAARWLFELSSGEVSLAVAELPMGKEGLERFPESVASINERLRDARDRAGESILIDDGRWNTEAFVMAALELSGSAVVCDACRRRVASEHLDPESGAALCLHCRAEERIGRMLPQSRYVAYYSDRRGFEAGPVGGFALVRHGELPPGDPAIVVDLDGRGEGSAALPLVGSFRSRYIPHNRETGAAVMFEELGRLAIGRPALGFLKMDVDNLGYLFARGFQKTSTAGELADHGSVSRVAALARTLEVFFSGYLEVLLRTEFPNIYLVYSGGDDVAAVGPWNEIFDLGPRIRDEFRRYTGGNAAWSFSAGVAVTKPRTPVTVAMQEADELLGASKEDRRLGRAAVASSLRCCESAGKGPHHRLRNLHPLGRVRIGPGPGQASARVAPGGSGELRQAAAAIALCRNGRAVPSHAGYSAPTVCPASGPRHSPQLGRRDRRSPVGAGVGGLPGSPPE